MKEVQGWQYGVCSVSCQATWSGRVFVPSGAEPGPPSRAQKRKQSGPNQTRAKKSIKSKSPAPIFGPIRNYLGVVVYD